MSSTTGRSAARRARIARQFRQVHDRTSAFMARRLAPFWARLTDSIMAELSRAHSEHIYIDQIFRPAEWRPLFNAALMPAVKTTVYTGVSFEAEWIHSATGEATRQAVARVTNDLAMDLDGQNGQNFDADLQSIQSRNFSIGISESFFGQGEGAANHPFPGRSSFDSSPLIRQRGRGPNPDLPGINVAISDQMAGDIGRFLETRSVGVWAKVGMTTTKALRETIRIGLREGDSLADLTKRIRGTLTHYSNYEARRIARTETTGAMNFGQHLERTELGIEHKEWVSTIDARTRGVGAKDRFDHVNATGQTTKNDVPFIVSAESLMYPGDIMLGASAGNVIHCRCCAVGAWPHDTLTGGLGGGYARPAAPAMSPDDTASYKASQALTAEQNSALTKARIRQLTSILAKHNDELEKVRKETLAHAEKLADARTKALKAEENITRANYRFLTAPEKSKAKFQKEIDQAIEDARLAGEDVSDLIRNKSDHIARTLGAGKKRASIELTFEDNITDEMKEKARKAADFIQKSSSRTATGGDLKLHVKLTEDGRAYYNPETRTLHMDPKNKIDVYVHEMGHSIEDAGEYTSSAKGFLHSRTQDNNPTVLRNKFSGKKFDPDEVSLEDKFAQSFVTDAAKRGAYTGKYYNGATEIISMGMELMYNDAVAFARRDPEFFKYIAGVMRGLVQIP